jgi:homoserine dehydrogenase
MPHVSLALLGFGNVGQALARLLLAKQAELQERYGLTFAISGIATGRRGAAIDPAGIDLHAALDLMQAGEPLSRLSRLPAPVDSFDFIRRCEAGVLFENTPVNYATGQPAVDHLRTALEMGMHAITANKGPVVHAYRALSELADRKGVHFYFESTVMDGAPIFSLFREALPAARLKSLRGVLNSTTNMILTRMEAGETFEQAVAYCQQIGIAETDPSGDIDGWDAAVKVAALATVLFDTPLLPGQVDRQGIRGITPAGVRRAAAQRRRWKLVCSARRTETGVEARVAPELVSVESPFYQVSGTTSLVQFETDVLGLLSVLEENPGPHTTAYGLLADFLNAVRQAPGLTPR